MTSSGECKSNGEPRVFGQSRQSFKNKIKTDDRKQQIVLNVLLGHDGLLLRRIIRKASLVSQTGIDSDVLRVLLATGDVLYLVLKANVNPEVEIHGDAVKRAFGNLMR